MPQDSLPNNQQPLYDIAKVCQMLKTTSRTLRFYQEKGIIESTTSGLSNRRRYTQAQIDKIRNVLALRALGLSVQTIRDLQKEDTNLKMALLLRKAQMVAAIQAKQKEIHTLNEALLLLDSADVCAGRLPHWGDAPVEETLKNTARICADAVISGDTEKLYEHLTPQLIAYMPREVYEKIREDTLAPLGNLTDVGEVVRDPCHTYVFYVFATFEYLNLCIKMVFCHDRIAGLWLTYDQPERKNL